MAVRTKRLAVWRSTVANQLDLIYTCGPEETVIVKSLQLFARQAAPGQAQLVLDTPTISATGLFYWTAAAQFDSINIQPWWVLLPGDTLSLRSTVTNGHLALISGAELEGLAD